jgi:hypothetical protein
LEITMTPQYPPDAAFTHLLQNVLNPTNHAEELAYEQANEAVNNQAEQLLAMQRRMATPPPHGFQPGQIVRWKSGLKNRLLPKQGERAIVMEVLDPPVFDLTTDLHGSNLFREPLTLAMGIHNADGDFLVFHVDGRRFEVVDDSTDSGAQP